MYFPILRGRQNELIAIRDLVDADLLGPVIPVIEPVKASSTLIRTLESFVLREHECYVVMNPAVGVFERELQLTPTFENTFREIVSEGGSWIKPCFRVSDNMLDCIHCVQKNGIDTSCAAVIYDRNYDEVYHRAIIDNSFGLCFVNDAARRRVRGMERILLSDPFHVLPRNADYRKTPDEFFSEDHQYYGDDGYTGFADYSVVGSAYSEGGFRPRAVAIHIVYEYDDGSLHIHHAVSEDSDFMDVASLYSNALEKLFTWIEDMGRNIGDTSGLKHLRASYNDQSFPGLGMAKRWSIMHHLELVSTLLER